MSKIIEHNTQNVIIYELIRKTNNQHSKYHKNISKPRFSTDTQIYSIYQTIPNSTKSSQ